jgi:plastocyanin
VKQLVALFALALACTALVACGGGDGSSSATGGAGGGSIVEFEADPDGELAYTTTEASAEAGKVTIDFDNPQNITHNVVIRNSEDIEVGRTDLIVEEEASTRIELKPGKYTFYCAMPGHREAGMTGTLTVE